MFFFVIVAYKYMQCIYFSARIIISLIQCCLQWSIWRRCRQFAFSWRAHGGFFTDKMWSLLWQWRRYCFSCYLLSRMPTKLLPFTQGGLVLVMYINMTGC